jgi:hypothetical protein
MKYWLCIVFSVVFLSCDKSPAVKTEDTGNNQTESGAITGIEDTAVVSEDNAVEDSNINNAIDIATDFTPKNQQTLVPDDFISLGLTNFQKMSQLIARLPPEVLPTIGKIIIDFPGVEDFKGIEAFPELRNLHLSFVDFSDLTDIAAAKILDWLYITDSKLQSLSGISNMNKLYVLNLNGTTLADIESGKDMPPSVEILSLNRFEKYKEFLEYVPDTVEMVYLQENGINSLSEIEYLQDRKNLKCIDIWRNNVSEEEIHSKTNDVDGRIYSVWEHIEVIWFDNR